MTKRKAIKQAASEGWDENKEAESDSSIESEEDVVSPRKKKVPKLDSSSEEEGDDELEKDGSMESSSDKDSCNKPYCIPTYARKETEEDDDDENMSDSSFIDDTFDSSLGSGAESDDFEPPDPGYQMTADIDEYDDDDLEDEEQYGRKLKSESQVASICRLDISTIDGIARSCHVSFSTSLEERIHWIVKDYNAINKEKRGTSSSNYVMTEIKKYPRVKCKDKIHFKGEDFQFVLYVQEIRKGIPFLTDFGIRMTSAVIHSIVFHYRGMDEIFAVTTGAAWTVVEKFCDFSFSALIAARLLSEEGSVESTRKGLVGSAVQSRKVHKSAQAENPYELLEFCVNYTAEFRPTASMFKLSYFQPRASAGGHKEHEGPETPESEDNEEIQHLDRGHSSSHKSPKKPSTSNPLYSEVKGLRAIVNLRSIRIQKKLPASDRLSVLDIFSSIVQGKKTYNIYGKEEKDSSAHTKYLTPVDSATSKKLNSRLSLMIHDAISSRSSKKSRLDDLLNFQLIHKHFTRYVNGEKFMVTYKDKSLANLPEEWKVRPPSLKEVTTVLGNSDLVDLDSDNSEEEFENRLHKVKIKFSEASSGKQLADKLVNMIDGLVVSEDDETVYSVYWHVQGRWTLLGGVYLLTVHQEAMKFVRTSLPLQGTPDAVKYELKCSWPAVEQVEAEDIESDGTASTSCRYSQKFIIKFLDKIKTNTGIFVPEENHGLFHFLRVTFVSDRDATTNNITGKIEVAVYFIIPSLNYEVVDRGLQISSAVMNIKKAAATSGRKKVGGSEVITKDLKSIFSNLSTNYESFRRYFPKFHTFIAALADATVCIAVGKGVNKDDISRHVPLEKFAKFPETITVEYLQDAMLKQELSDSDLTNELQDAFGLGQQNDEFHALSTRMLEEFKKADLISLNGKVTDKFLAITKRKFKFPEKKLSQTLRQFVYESVIEDLQARGFTLLARLAFIKLERQLHETGCSVKLIDIM